MLPTGVLVARACCLPSPRTDMRSWLSAMQNAEWWATSVSAVSFFESSLDSEAHAQSALPGGSIPHFSCSQCGAGFRSERALSAHRTGAHGARTPWSTRIDGSGRCPICRGNYRTRLRVINHVRCSSCRHRIGEVDELPPAVLDALRAMDRAAIRGARKDGMSVPRAIGPALGHAGKGRPGGQPQL